MNSSEVSVPLLGELAALIRSKNAGPFMLTIDVMLPDRPSYDRVRQSPCLSVARVSALYGIPESQILRFESDPALAVKISFPRPWVSGCAADRDIYGGQFHSPLVLMPVD